MQAWKIRQSLTPCTSEEIKDPAAPFVVILTPDEWKNSSEAFDMGIELEIDPSEVYTTKAEVNYDSLTGGFSIPDREQLADLCHRFAFALDEKGIVLIDGTGTAERIISTIAATKRWKLPCLERFLYDFLEQIVHRDQSILEQYELELDAIEDQLSDEETAKNALKRVNEIRCDLRELKTHYEQLLDLGQELEENENNFFKHENLRYFRLYISRIERLRDLCASVRDYTVQLREFYESQLNMKQNRVMTLLTLVTMIFMPLTLIAGWYGMNFRNMPELESRFGYPVVIIISILIVIASLLFFKKKKWLI